MGEEQGTREQPDPWLLPTFHSRAARPQPYLFHPLLPSKGLEAQITDLPRAEALWMGLSCPQSP